MAKAPNYPTREAWLKAAEAIIAPRIVAANDGKAYPKKTRVSVGFPKSSKGRGTAIGQCWDTGVSADGTYEMFVSPILGDVVRVLDVLTHEMIHAAVGIEAGHGKEFGKVARKVGLGGKLTATVATPALVEWFKSDVMPKLGAYPHAAMRSVETARTPKAGKTYLLKAECDECGFTVRVTKKWVSEVGAPCCPKHGKMTVEGMD